MDLDIVLDPVAKLHPWGTAMEAALPGCRVHLGPGEIPCRYGLVWSPSPAFFAAQPGLRAVFSLGAGVDGILRTPGLPEHLPIYRVEDAGMAAQMREYVLWAVLRIRRQFESLAAAARQGSWRRPVPAGLTELRVGVLGAGVLGRSVLEGLGVLGCQRRCWSRSPKAVPGVWGFAGTEQLEAFLQGCDIVVGLLPSTAETRGLLDAQRLRQLPAGAWMINLGRADLLDDAALLDAIRAGHLAGAILDVCREEPLPLDHPFFAEPRILVTPHIAARSDAHAVCAQIAARIRALESGQPAGRPVDRGLGY